MLYVETREHEALSKYALVFQLLTPIDVSFFQQSLLGLKFEKIKDIKLWHPEAQAVCSYFFDIIALVPAMKILWSWSNRETLCLVFIAGIEGKGGKI